MSIDYYAMNGRDRAEARSVFEKETTAPPLDLEAIHASLQRAFGSGGGWDLDRSGMRWRGPDGGWIDVDLEPSKVSIHHGTSGGERVVALLEGLLETLASAGLHVYDPQSDDFLEFDAVTTREEPSIDSGPRPYAVTTVFGEGDVIVHKTWGTGTVERARGGKIDVRFEAGLKTLAHGR